MRHTAAAALTTLALIAVAAVVSAQPAKPAASILVMKDTPTSAALIKLADNLKNDQKEMNDVIQQAKFSMDENQKTITGALNAAYDSLTKELRKDKHYKAQMDQIDKLQAQLTGTAAKANQDFIQKSSGIRQRIGVEQAQIAGFVPVVIKESSMPEGTTFDPVTKKWSPPVAAAK